MDEEAKSSMILCAALEPVEQEKVERLDGLIAEAFIRAGNVVRICRGRSEGSRRLLDFYGPEGIVASILASSFLAASNDDAVVMVTRSHS